MDDFNPYKNDTLEELRRQRGEVENALELLPMNNSIRTASFYVLNKINAEIQARLTALAGDKR
jgi:hypothetical protein